MVVNFFHWNYLDSCFLRTNLLKMVNLTIPHAFKVTHEQFKQLARVNRDWRLERTATGELVSMPPIGSITSNRNLDRVTLPAQLK